MKFKEIKKLTKDELDKTLNKLKKDLFNMRFKKTNGPLEDTSKFPLIKKDIAKILTKINSKR
jgi:large subunit ribosomal protein L29